ncbi:MAG TPA: tyrosinase family protein [Candidatus Nanopelagicales bacterium]|nr:tyrosinase family protein [Candidatus Nanopelagicales bacterium]
MSNGNSGAQVAVRRNVHTLETEGPELAAFARGVAVMQTRPREDPTSWIYQANIHGTRDMDLMRAWDTCQHGSFFFLSWHRMYLYWFERILREASGEASLALPYWNYSVDGQRALPAAFRVPAAPRNPLYVRQRNRDINEGVPLDESEGVFDRAFRFENFAAPRGELSFGGWIVPRPQHFSNGHGQLELQPHNNIHTRIGGLMSDPFTAARDPIFWLHHANIDRLWKRWLDLGGGRDFPPRTGAAAPWWEAIFVFFDERGEPVQMTGADIVDTVGQLGYRYDDDPEPAPEERVERVERVEGRMAKKAAGRAAKAKEKGMAAAQEQPRRAAGVQPRRAAHEQPRPVAGVQPRRAVLGKSAGEIMLHGMPVRAPVRMRRGAALEAASIARADVVEERLRITLNQVDFERYPSMTYEIYLNAPEGQAPGPRSRYYVANLGFFGLTPPADVSFDITSTVAALRESGEWMGEPEVSFIPTLRPAVMAAEADAPMEEMEMEMEMEVEPVTIGEVTIMAA